MADYLLAAHIQVTGGAEASAQFNQLAVQINNFGRAAQGANTGGLAAGMDKATESATRFERIMGQVGVAVTRMVTYQAIGAVFDVFQEGVQGVIDFDDQMTQSLAIQTGVTDKMRGNMESLAKSIAVDLGMAPGKVAEGFYFLASAGLTVEQQLNALPVVANFAKAGMFSLEQATEKLYDSLTALGMKSKDPQTQLRNLITLSDLLVTAAIASQGSVQDFTTALANKAGGDIKSYGIDLKEGIALLEVFADRGIKGARAGTAFDMTIRDMAIKAVTNADAFKKFGIEVYNSEGNFNSLSTIFGQLDAALLHLPLEQRTAALKEMGYTLRSGQIIQTLLGSKGVFDEFAAGLANAGGTAERVAQNQMESLRAKMAQLKSLSIVFAINGFEQLQTAAAWLGETFAPAILEIIDLMGHLVNGIRPVATAFGGIVSVAVTKGLEGIAEAMELVFGAINAHPGVIQGVGAALAGIAGAQIVSGLVSIGKALGETIYLKALMVQDAINGMIIRIMTVAQTEGALAAVRVGLSGILTVLSSPVAIGAGIGVSILLLYKAAQDAKRAVDEVRDGLERKYDTTSLTGMSQAMDEMQIKADEFHKKQMEGAAILTVSIKDIFQMQAYGDEIERMNKEFANMTIGIQLMASMATGSTIPMQSWAEGLKNAGMNMNDIPIDATRTKFQEMGVAMSAAGADTESVGKLMAQLAREAGIDIKLPIDQWGPKLADVWVKFSSVREITSEIGGVAEGSTSGMSSMEKAITTLRDAAATAEDKMKALKTAMDGLSGGQQNLFDMETNFVEGMEKLGESLVKNGTAFTSFTAAGRENRDALSSAADKAREFALAQAEASGNVQEGVAHLQGYADALAGTMRNAGMAEPAIQTLLQQMGLTPTQIETLFKMTMPADEPQKTQGELDKVADPRLATIAPTTEAAAKATVENDLAALEATRTPSIAPFPEEGAVANTETVLTTTARGRDSNANQWPSGFQSVEEFFNRTSRFRNSQADQYGTGWNSVEGFFDRAARYRASQADQIANTAAAEQAMNTAARNRTSTISVNVVTTGTVYAGPLGTGIAEGGIVHAYASGGFENHVAQIGKMGHSRVWNEPETGGEAYIPLALGKRSRSMAIWEETGRILGAQASSREVNMTAPINVSVNGATDPEATGRAVASQVQSGIEAAMSRVLVELRSA